ELRAPRARVLPLALRRAVPGRGHEGSRGMNAKRISAAADWYLRVSEDDLSERELAAWLEWRKDPENRQEFRGIGALSEPFVALPIETNEVLEEIESREKNQRRFWLAAASLAAALVLSVGIWWARPVPSPQTVRAELRSDGANRQATLPDGSS